MTFPKRQAADALAKIRTTVVSPTIEKAESLRIRNPIERYFRTNESGRLIQKWSSYFDVYHRHFRKFRHRP